MTEALIDQVPPARRPVQTSLIEGIEHPVGPMPESVMFGDNAQLLKAVAPLYLTGSVLDVTYGQGAWWRRFHPQAFAGHDLAADGIDFRDLPYEDASWDAVCFDPPYVPRQGPKEAKRHRERLYRARYGLGEPRGPRELEQLIYEGLAECARVARRYVLVKCCDYVKSRQLSLAHVGVILEGERLGLRVHDFYVHATGTGPGGHQILTVKRARRAHSYLIVFDARPRRSRKAAAA